MSMALSALGYGKNAAGTVVKTASVAPDKTGDLLIFLGTKLKGLAAGMSICGENLKFSGTIDLMVSRGEITGDEVAAVAAAKGIDPEAALKLVALQKISGAIEENNSQRKVAAAKKQVEISSEESVTDTVTVTDTVSNTVDAVAAAVSSSEGPTVIPVIPARPEKKDIQNKKENMAANNGSQSTASVATSEKSNTVTNSDTAEEIPAHVLALELC